MQQNLKFLFPIIIFLTCISCNVKNGQKHLTQIGPTDSITQNQTVSLYDDLNSVDFEITPSRYIISFQTKRNYKTDSITFNVVADLDTTGDGQLTKLVIFLDKDTIPLNYVKYPIFKTRELSYFKDPGNNFIFFNDYNFDEFPDIAIRDRTASGNKNQVYNVYLFSPDKKRYMRNKFLSEAVNLNLNPKDKTLSTFYAGGMSSQIYHRNVYKWNSEQFEIIRKEEQDYLDSLKVYIRVTKTLSDTSWTIRTDTLKDEELSR